MKLSSGYEMEQLELSKLTEQLIVEIGKEESKNLNVNKFMKITKKYANLSELDVTSVREMIDKIIVHAPDRSTGKRTQQVDIHYNFVGIIGKLDIEKIREELKQDHVASTTGKEKAVSGAS